MRARYNWIPTELSQSDFNEFIFAHTARCPRGPDPKILCFKMFNYFLCLMYTRCQRSGLPIDKDSFSRPEISYSRLFRHFQHWISSGFFDRVFEASVAKLAKESFLDTSVLHGDGITAAAKKGR